MMTHNPHNTNDQLVAYFTGYNHQDKMIESANKTHKLSYRKLNLEKAGIKDYIRAVNTQLRRFDKSFKKLKNFKNDNWQKMTKDLPRYRQFTGMIGYDEKDFKSRAIRLRKLILPLKQRVERVTAEKAAARNLHTKTSVTSTGTNPRPQP